MSYNISALLKLAVAKSYDVVKQKLHKLKIKLTDYTHLLFKSAHANYYRIETCKKDTTGRIHCDVSFDSYVALKRFQNKLRKFSFGLGSLVITTVMATLVLNLSTGPIRDSFAATFDFGQASWIGGASVETATHASNQSGWSKYLSKDAGLVTGAQISLATSSYSVMQTDEGVTNGGFNLAGNIFGQTEVTGTGAAAAVSLQNIAVPAGTKQIVGGWEFACALKTDGSVWCWGINNIGQLGDGSGVNRLIPTQVSGLTAGTCKKIGAGSNHACALKVDGSLWCWGHNNYGQLGDNTIENKLAPVQVFGLSAGTVLSVDGGHANTCALKTDGSMWCWGQNNYGQLGNNSTIEEHVPFQVSGLVAGTVKEIGVGYEFSCALKSDGSTWCWGANVSTQIGDNTSTTRLIPTQVLSLTAGTTKKITIGEYHACAIKADGSLWCWGSGGQGEIGDGVTGARGVLTQVSGFTASVTKAVVAGTYSTCAIKTDGSMWCWGYNNYGQLGDNTVVNKLIPTQVIGFAIGTTKEIYTTDGLSCAIKTNGSAMCWGGNDHGQIGDNTTIEKHVPTQVSGLVDGGGQEEVVAGDYHTCALKTDGSVWCWGLNSVGLLGDNTIVDKYVPTQVSGLTTGTVKAIAAGAVHTCALKTDGSVRCWGSNYAGQIGDNTSGTNRLIPTQVSGLTTGTVKAITAGSAHTCVLKTEGSMWCWGMNDNSQIGDNTTVDKQIPTQVSGLTTGIVSAITGGVYHTCAIKSDGSMWCWGYNVNGQLGDNTLIRKSVPTQVSGLTTGIVSAITGGVNHTCAIKSDGSMWCWGNNYYGQIGDNTIIQRNVPTQVSGLTTGTVKAITTGVYHACALKSDGSMWCWGRNANGQIGDTTIAQRNAPTQVSGLTVGTAQDITAGDSHTCSLKTDGSTWCWGGNDNGQIGDTSIVEKHIPTQVSTLIAPGGITYATNGTFISGIINIGKRASAWANLNWNANLNGQTITTKARSCATSDCSGATDWASCSNITNGNSITSGACATSSHQYVQYQATLTTASITITPTFNDITINYNSYNATGTLVSSKYDSSSNDNVVAGLTWTENESLPSGTGVLLSLRSAADAAGLDSATWSDFTNVTADCSKLGAVVTCNAAAIPAGMNDGLDDGWMQYRISFNSDGAYTPTVSTAAIVYAVNTPPEVTNVIASQGVDGKVSINYSVIDIDTTSGSINPGYISPSFEYWNGSSWIAATTFAVGDLDNKAVVEASSTLYTATWDAKTDYPEQYFNNTFKVRVSANDNEAVNNLGYSESGLTTLDTANPSLGVVPMSVDASVSPANLTMSMSDDSELEMKISLNSDLSGAGWIVYATNTTITLASDPDTVYVQFQDAHSNASGITNASTPETPVSMMIQDTSNMIVVPNEYRLFMAWKTITDPTPGFADYTVYRSENQIDWSPIGTVPNRLTNYYGDNSTLNDINYYYKITSTDIDGNISPFSQIVNGKANGVQDAGEGGGGTIASVPPTISNVQLVETNTTWAKIVWDTDVLSNSSLEYIATSSTPIEADFADAPFKGFATMRATSTPFGQHEVTIDGLNSNTTYYYRVKSTGANGIEGTKFENTYSFITTDGPIISSSTIEVLNKTNNSLTIVWNTDIPANSFVGYSIDPIMISPAPIESGQDDSTLSHSVTLSGLNQGTSYSFYVKSGTAKDNNLGTFYTAKTTSDATAPTISDVSSESKRTSAIVYWQTDEVADSKIILGFSSGSYNQSIESIIETRTHVMSLTNLHASTTYYYKIISSDANGNIATSAAEYIFTTEDIKLTNVMASTTGATSIHITWNTDENATSSVWYGTNELTLSPYQSVGSDDAVMNHALDISALTQATKYYYKVVSTIDGYTAHSPIYYFTSGDTIAPIITTNSIVTINITTNSATINWETDENANSIVEWGTSTSVYLASTTNDTLTRIHSLNINNLNTFTDYYIRVSSMDANANGTTSTEYVFKTSNFKISNVFAIAASSSAVVTWNTDAAASSQVEYSINADFSATTFYPAVVEEAATTSHTIVVAGLQDGLVYYYKVRSVKEGALNQSPIYTFATVDETAPVIVTQPAVSVITDTTATIFWETDEISDSFVYYGTNQGGPYANNENSTRLTTIHFVRLDGLTASTTYYYNVESRDGASNLALSTEYSFTTLSTQVAHPDLTNPGNPTVMQKSDTEAVIAIPSANTTATSKLCYATTPIIDIDACAGQTILTPTKSHTYYLTGLTASTTYYIKTKITDSENGAISFDSAEINFQTLSTRYTEEDLMAAQNGLYTEEQMQIKIAEIESKTTQIANLNQQLADLQADASTTVEELQAKQAEIDLLNQQLIDLQVSASTTLEELQAKEAEVDLLTEQLADFQDGSYSESQMQAKIDEINTKTAEIADLQRQLSAASNRGGGGVLVVDKTDKIAPTISAVNIAEVGEDYANITWNTNEEASSMIGYGFSINYDSAESDYQSYLKRVKTHSIRLKNLLPSATYHFSAVSADAWGNMTSSPDFVLNTLAAGEEVKKDIIAEVKEKTVNTLEKIQEMIDELLKSGKVNPEDIRAAIQKTGEPPLISGLGPEISNLTSKSVTITWKTNRKANSIISYYVESLGRDAAEQAGNYSALVTDHSVNISNLAPGRKYMFTAQSVDALGNVGASNLKLFETTGIPLVSEVSMSNITNSSVDISWISNTETSSELDYGFTNIYGQKANSDANNFVLIHNLRINDLQAGQVYHFKAKGVSRRGDVISSDDYTFTTLSSFDVLTYSVNKITEKSANITWKTTNDSTSELEYTNTNSKTTDMVKAGEFTKDHSIRLDNLSPGTKYIFKIKGKDRSDQATESSAFEFSTLIDTQAPIIEYVQTDMALISKGNKDSVQAVVTWRTNEPSTSEIIFAEGGAKNLPTLDPDKILATSTDKKTATAEINLGNEKFIIAKDGGNLTQKHVIVITDFKPSTVYTFKARSIDEAGNVSYSKDYTILAPSREESVLQIIIKTFEDTFGWLKM